MQVKVRLICKLLGLGFKQLQLAVSDDIVPLRSSRVFLLAAVVVGVVCVDLPSGSLFTDQNVLLTELIIFRLLLVNSFYRHQIDLLRPRHYCARPPQIRAQRDRKIDIGRPLLKLDLFGCGLLSLDLGCCWWLFYI